MLTVPHSKSFVDLDASLIDTSGNLFFTTVTNDNETPGAQDLTTYKADLEKDSLIHSDFIEQGTFSNIHLQENNKTGNINVSGLLNRENYAVANVEKSFFVTEIKQKSFDQGKINFYSIRKIVDSIYPGSVRLNAVNTVLNQDSGYNFYVSGILNFKTDTKQFSAGKQYNLSPNFPSPDLTLTKNYQINSSSYSSIFASNNMPGSVPASGYTPAFNSTNNVYLAGSNQQSVTEEASGDNFFSMVSIDNKGAVNMQSFKQGKENSTLPEYEYIANTAKNIHYIYSRTLNNNSKQEISDIVFEKGQKTYSNLTVTSTRYTLLLANAVQVSFNILVIPYLNNNSLSFAKMELE